MFMHNRRGQAMLEYALLLALVIAAWIIMQMVVKRHIQGGLKDAAEKVGDTYSVSGTTIDKSTTMRGDQTIIEETASDSTIQDFDDSGLSRGDVVQQGGYSVSRRAGGEMTSETTTTTDAAKNEKVRWGEY